MSHCHLIIFADGNISKNCPTGAGIYGWRNNVNGKWYVGKSLRIRERISMYKRGRFRGQRLFFAAVMKYGIKNFTCYKLMDCCPSKIALNFWERSFVKEKCSFGPNGYNLTPGGDGANAMTEEIKKKLSIIGVGKKHTDTTKQKIRMNGNRGRKFGPRTEEFKNKLRIFYLTVGVSEKTRELMRLSQTGKKRSKEQRLRMQLAALRRWDKEKQLNRVEKCQTPV